MLDIVRVKLSLFAIEARGEARKACMTLSGLSYSRPPNPVQSFYDVAAKAKIDVEDAASVLKLI